MKTLKSKLFGDNRMNFYGWIATALLIILASLWLVLRSVDAGALKSPECLLLLAIYTVLLGHLGLGLQSYCARVAKTLESEEKKEDDGTAA